MKLYDYQIDAVNRMKNGCILCGGVGSGKSRTALAYFYREMGGDMNDVGSLMDDTIIKDLYIITTARKRDTLEWEGELVYFLMTTNKEDNLYRNTVVVDSWNNIGKYTDVKDAFFIFDEQRVVGYGAWTKSFLKIAKQNQWILLSATPGDTWLDYMPVFIANGFYKNKTDFTSHHVIYDWHTNFPRVKQYLNPGRLIKYRNSILVNMDFHRETISHHEDVIVDYDVAEYKEICRSRVNPETGFPLENASQFCYALRKVVNSDKSRIRALLDILIEHPRIIIFYNFDYEWELLKEVLNGANVEYSSWNGHVHQDIPTGACWVYLVNYGAGAEGWNCISTDTMVFWSQSYSYRTMEQAAGRIDRLNTPFSDLYFYHFKSRSGIDLSIAKALKNKKKFNESRFYGGEKS